MPNPSCHSQTFEFVWWVNPRRFRVTLMFASTCEVYHQRPEDVYKTISLLWNLYPSRLHITYLTFEKGGIHNILTFIFIQTKKSLLQLQLMMRPWYENIFRVIGTLWGRPTMDSADTGLVTRSFDIPFAISLKKKKNTVKQSIRHGAHAASLYCCCFFITKYTIRKTQNCVCGVWKYNVPGFTKTRFEWGKQTNQKNLGRYTTIDIIQIYVNPHGADETQTHILKYNGQSLSMATCSLAYIHHYRIVWTCHQLMLPTPVARSLKILSNTGTWKYSLICKSACEILMAKKLWKKPYVNSSSPRAAYMSQWIRSVLVKIMACRLVGAKPLSKPRLEYC